MSVVAQAIQDKHAAQDAAQGAAQGAAQAAAPVKKKPCSGRYGETMDKSPMAKQGGGQKSESLLLGGHPNHLVQASLRLDWIPSVTATF